MLIIGLQQTIKQILWSPFTFCQACCKNFGVLFDSDLKFDQHVTKLVQYCFYHLRNISRIRPILNVRYAETVVHAFISSCLDNSNNLFSGLNKKKL